MWKHEPYTVPNAAFFVLGAVVSLVSYGVLVAVYHSLPDVVPIHYGYTGWPDGYAEKGLLSVFGLGIIHLGVSILILWLYQHPEYANVPGKVPLKKLARPYREAITWIIRHMATMMFVLVSLIFCYISLTDISVSLDFTQKLNMFWLSGLVLVLVVINIVYLVMIVRITKLAAERKKLPSGW